MVFRNCDFKCHLAIHHLAHFLTVSFDLKMGSLVHLPHVVVISKLLNTGFVLFKLVTFHLVLYVLILFCTLLFLYLHKKLPKGKCGYIIVTGIVFGSDFFNVLRSVPKRIASDHIVTNEAAPQLRVH